MVSRSCKEGIVVRNRSAKHLRGFSSLPHLRTPLPFSYEVVDREIFHGVQM